MKISPNEKFVLRSGPRGFGYAIYGKDKNGVSNELVFHTSNKEQCLKVFESMEEGRKLPEPLYDWEPKLLKIETKHHTYYFVIRNPEELDQVSFNFVKREFESKYGALTEWEVPDKYKEIIEDSVIEACPDKDAKKFMQDKNSKNKEQLKFYTKHNNLVKIVGTYVKENKVSEGYKMLNSCECIYYSKELNEFDNF